MDEVIRAFYTVLNAVLDVIGQVLAFLVKLVAEGVAYYNHATMAGRIIGVLLIFAAAWALTVFINIVVNTAARYAVLVLVIVLVLALVSTIVEPPGHYIVLR